MNNTSQIGQVLNDAFRYWIKTLPYQAVFTVLYFAIQFFFASYALRYYGLWEPINELFASKTTDFPTMYKKLSEISQTENGINFYNALFIIKAVIFPLNIGFLKIYRKIDLEQMSSLGDLFAGYRGFLFFVFGSYALFWNIVYNFSAIFPPLILVWIGITMFVPCIIFFKNVNYFKALSLSFGIFKRNVLLILIAVIVAILFSYSGLIMFFFGIVLTFPFWNAIIYALYKKIGLGFED